MEKGQTVYLKTVNNLARRETKIFKANVASIGRKYFTLESDECLFLDRTKFDLNTMREHSMFSPDYEVYLSFEDAQNSHLQPLEKRKTIDLVSKLSYNQLIEVQKFIKQLTL